MTEVQEHPVIAEQRRTVTAVPVIDVVIDYETQSACNLKQHGSYVYARHPTTRVLCAAMQILGHRIFWTPILYNIAMPLGVTYAVGMEWLRQLFSSNIRAIAHHEDFEIPISKYTLGLPEPIGGWADTMDQTLMRGLPGGADACGTYLLGRGKDIEGYQLMMKHCKPDRKGNMPVITDAVMQRYVPYNFGDVDIQLGIIGLFGADIKPDWEQQVNHLHKRVNARGVMLDRGFAETLKSFDNIFKQEARAEVEAVTRRPDGTSEVMGVDLTRTAFLLEWFKSKGVELPNMRMETLNEVMEEYEENQGSSHVPYEVIVVIRNRLVVSRAALSKVDAAMRCVCEDGRIYALFRYWGARTGRWTSNLLQIQNMKRPDDKLDIERAIDAVERKDRVVFEECCAGKPPYVLLSSLIRGILIPKPGCVFVIGDFSAIESRVLLWLAEDWEGLKDHIDADEGRVPDVYCVFAGDSIFHRPITKKDKFERSIGKIGELACGYQGGVGAVLRFAALARVDLVAAGIDPQEIVNAWRGKHPRVVDMWYRCEEAFRLAIQNPGRVYRAARCEFTCNGSTATITLPSGRVLTYMNARLENSQRKGWEQSIITAYDSAVKGKTKREELHGGRIVENIDQAVARDVLAWKMLELDELDDLVMHVHDEAVAEVPEEFAETTRHAMQQIMSTAPPWAPGLPLACKPTCERRYGK